MSERVCKGIEVRARIIRIGYFNDMSPGRTEKHIGESGAGDATQNRSLSHKGYLLWEAESFQRDPLETSGFKDGPNLILVLETSPGRVFAAYENPAVRSTSVWADYLIANLIEEGSRKIINADNSQFVHVK
jgi:hypothetical protein